MEICVMENTVPQAMTLSVAATIAVKTPAVTHRIAQRATSTTVLPTPGKEIYVMENTVPQAVIRTVAATTAVITSVNTHRIVIQTITT